MTFLILSVIVVPDLNTADLAAFGLGKIIYEFDDTGILIGCCGLLNISLEFLNKLGRACIAVGKGR